MQNSHLAYTRRQFWGLLEAVLGPSWGHFGAISGPFWAILAETGDHEVNGSEGLAFLRDLRRLKTTFGRVAQGSSGSSQGSMAETPSYAFLASLLLFLGSSCCPLEVYDSTWLQDGSQTASRDTKTTKIVIFHRFFNDFLNCEMAHDGLKMSA